jgi:PAS domain S-box-containing protein
MDDISQRGDEIRVVVRVQAQAEHFYVTLASISDAVIATDTAGHVTFLNRRAEALTGWRRAEAVGKGIAAVLHLIDADTQQPVTSPVRQVLRDRSIPANEIMQIGFRTVNGISIRYAKSDGR